jgi:hypothetical protein
MANKNLLTYNAKVSQVEQTYFAPVASLFGTTIPISTLYCFLSRVVPWPDEDNPPVPTQDQQSIKTIFRNMFVAKLINSSNISPVTQRIDWTSGEIYDYYQDNVDMFAVDGAGNLIKRFYIRNKYDQVFKCLWNNNDAEATDEPFFQPGSYGTNNIYKGTDGYKWKYMYTIDVGSKTKFMDSSWMPIPVGENTPNPIQTSAGYGDVEVINVVDGGSGYDPSNAAITVVVTGDGMGASGTATVEDGVITDIVVTNSGADYTYANVSVTSTLGSGATFLSPTSPIGGHAFDPVSEFGCSHVMVTVEFNSDESGNLPTEIDFRQIGLLINPIAQSSISGDVPYPANAAIYKTTTDFVVAPGFGLYVEDETVYQGNSLEEATFTGTVLSFDPAANVIRLINTVGDYTVNAPIFGNSSLTARTTLSVSVPDFILFSGYLTYVENRKSVQRSFDGIEQFKFVVGY